MNGFLCVLKPPGMTSSDVVVRVRRKLGKGAKVGHAGTLDPEASGVLPLMIGRAARLFDYLVDKEKMYVAQLKPGYATDTQDAHGAIIAGEGVRASVKLRRYRRCIPHSSGTDKSSATLLGKALKFRLSRVRRRFMPLISCMSRRTAALFWQYDAGGEHISARFAMTSVMRWAARRIWACSCARRRACLRWMMRIR